jgi:4-hydroxymandelate oxidase
VSTPPITLADFEEIARERMEPAEFVEVESFPPGNLTARRTRAAWDALALRPRVMPAAASPDLAVSVLGQKLGVPFMLAPAGYHTRAHPDGELASARASAEAGSLLVLSANPGHPPEDVASASDGAKWLQTYVFRDRGETERRVKEAERLGYTAICLTLDAHWPAKRPWRVSGGKTKGTAPGRLAGDPSRTHADPAATWADVDALRRMTPLPIVCKGIMTAEDAVLCVDHGVAAVIVSNHGARLDNTLATIEVLPEVVAAVNGRAEVYVDGGIRRGADVVKALALGARAVFIGRPLFWGLAHGGAPGLASLLAVLREEIEITMMLTGRPTIASLDRTLVTPMPELPPGHARA